MLLTAAVLLPVVPHARAQVAVDQGAIDGLKPSPPAAAKPKPPQTKPNSPASTATQKPVAARSGKNGADKNRASKPTTSKPVSAKPPPPPPRQGSVVIAPAPPPPVTMVTPALPPPHAAPDIAIPVSPDAKGTAAKILGGVRVTFGSGAAELNPTTVAALRSVARTIGADPVAAFNVYAYAEGAADDPSTPRRLSLSRGLAARSVLMSEGIASTRIYVRALGATVSEGPSDRVDVTQVGIAPAPS